MSVINKALSEMTDNKSPSEGIKKVEAPPVKQGPKTIWILFIALLFPSVGAWFFWESLNGDVEIVHYFDEAEPSKTIDVTPVSPISVPAKVASPTQQTVSESVTNIYQQQGIGTEKPLGKTPAIVDTKGSKSEIVNVEKGRTEPQPELDLVKKVKPEKKDLQNDPKKLVEKPTQEQTAKVNTVQMSKDNADPAAKGHSDPEEAKANTVSTAKANPVSTAKANKVSTDKANTVSTAKANTAQVPKVNALPTVDKVKSSLPSKPLTKGTMSIRQVELTPDQLATKSLSRAKKSLDANDFEGAINGYRTALRYVPQDEAVRKKLAALYYGRGSVRQSLDILQKGIALDRNSQILRLAAVTILVKEGVSEAALGLIEYLPPSPTEDYLAMRAGLAQQLNNHPIALESYQMLANRDQDNGKWWLGLGIQQERSEQFSQASGSYKKALNRIGLSDQTNAFIRERIAYIKSREEPSNAD